jgi:hypothetical protein
MDRPRGVSAQPPLKEARSNSFSKPKVVGFADLKRSVAHENLLMSGDHPKTKSITWGQTSPSEGTTQRKLGHQRTSSAGSANELLPSSLGPKYSKSEEINASKCLSEPASRKESLANKSEPSLSFTSSASTPSPKTIQIAVSTESGGGTHKTRSATASSVPRGISKEEGLAGTGNAATELENDRLDAFLQGVVRTRSTTEGNSKRLTSRTRKEKDTKDTAIQADVSKSSTLERVERLQLEMLEKEIEKERLLQINNHDSADTIGDEPRYPRRNRGQVIQLTKKKGRQLYEKLQQIERVGQDGDNSLQLTPGGMRALQELSGGFGFASPDGGEESDEDEDEDDSLNFRTNSDRTLVRQSSIELEKMLVKRSSVELLVEKGIFKEWNDSGDAASGWKAAHSPRPSRPRAIVSTERARLIAPIPSQAEWHAERGLDQDFVLGAYVVQEADPQSTPLYKLFFYNCEHRNYWGMENSIGGVLVSVVQGKAQPQSPQSSTSNSLSPNTSSRHRRKASSLDGKTKLFVFNNDCKVPVVHRVLIQCKHGTKQLFVRCVPDKAEVFKAIRAACGLQGYLPEIQEMKLRRIKIDIKDDLVKLEKSFLPSHYKFGVLYCKANQSENEMFANESSEEFDKFLNFLGNRITLKGWSNFAGGLDVRNDSTGTHSVYTNFRDVEIMFHVNTLLPYYPKDTQQVERKRHLGNDIVVIVYLEQGAQFDPTKMHTQFNHIYAVVSVTPDGSVQLEFAVKDGVRPFGPAIPPNANFKLDSKFRDFFLMKLINSEQAALKAAVFATKLNNTRKVLIEEIIEKIKEGK